MFHTCFIYYVGSARSLQRQERAATPTFGKNTPYTPLSHIPICIVCLLLYQYMGASCICLYAYQLMKDESKTDVVVTTYDALKSGRYIQPHIPSTKLVYSMLMFIACIRCTLYIGMRTVFRRLVWRSVILDEGHRVKNEVCNIITIYI